MSELLYEPNNDSLEVCKHLCPQSLNCYICNLEKEIKELAGKIKSLGISVQHDFKEKLSNIHLMTANHEGRITNLETLNEKCFDANPLGKIEDKFNYFQNKIDEIEEILAEFEDFMQKSDLNGKKQPFKCPICDGEGKLPPVRFHNTSSKPVSINAEVIEPGDVTYYRAPCHPCESKGIVWG